MQAAASKRKIRRPRGGLWLKVRQEHVAQALDSELLFEDKLQRLRATVLQGTYFTGLSHSAFKQGKLAFFYR